MESWSTNEVAINWNASLAWVTAFTAERAHAPAAPARSEPQARNAKVRERPAP
jgi:hypothetical protein